MIAAVKTEKKEGYEKTNYKKRTYLLRILYRFIFIACFYHTV
jgi:hypothetical protein